MKKINTDRDMLIEILVIRTGYSKEFFQKLTDEQIEYEYLSQLDEVKTWD
ncbi:MAG: hypothetical protein ACQEWV_30480 [Bacillota bacterium]